jgi:hypothetical protein
VTEYTITIRRTDKHKPETFSLYGKSKSDVMKFIKGVYRNRLLSVVTEEDGDAQVSS